MSSLRRVAIVGSATTRFGVLPGIRAVDLAAEAIRAAVIDSTLSPRQIGTAYGGMAISGILGGQECNVPQLTLREVGLTGIPSTRVENACSSSSTALREAWLAVASGLYDVALAFGVDTMTDAGTARATAALMSASDMPLEADYGMTFPSVFAMIARRHMELYGTTREQIAQVAVKNHRHGALNPLAHFQKPITVEQVLAGKMIADPLTIFDCCPVSDGASAVVLAAPHIAKRISRSVWLEASQQASGDYNPAQDITSFPPTIRAAGAAWEQAGLGPDDVDLFEVHDCFTMAELVHYEDLGLSPRGESGQLVASGATALGGSRPVNVSGGLKAKGHPVGATGISQVAEIVTQLRGEAGPRQVEGAKVGLAHCMGGFFHGDAGAVTVHILSK